MKRREMSSLARSLCEYLCSRNNDIAGYWRVGMLCAIAKRERRLKFSFKIYPGKSILIHNYEISSSQEISNKLVKFNLDSIEGCLSFFENGYCYADGTPMCICSISIAVTQGGRTGMSISHVQCRPHDPLREERRRMPSI
jgi:hypothetical protein